MKTTNFGQWLILKLVAKENVKIVTDENSSPIIADDLARAILHLVEKDEVGIFHCAPPIQINRYDFSVKLAKFFNFDVDLIRPTTVKDLGRNVSIGLNKCLDSKKITKTTGFHFLTLEESLSLIKEQYLIE
jgi:dTDP-4-dehydrorhamnose reductase